MLSHLLFSEKTTDTGDEDGADAGTRGGGAGFGVASSIRSALAASRSGGLGLTGNSVDYYDRRNSSLHEVFERLGIPIALSIVYAGVGRRGGLDVRFMNAGHFVCAPADAEGRRYRGAFAIRSTVDPV